MFIFLNINVVGKLVVFKNYNYLTVNFPRLFFLSES